MGNTRQGCGLLAFACMFAGLSVAPAQAQSGTEVVLHDFGNVPRGSSPESGVVRDPAGNLYGTTPTGGAANAGVVYKLDASGRQTVLYSFTGGAGGSGPMAGVTADSAGNLYGTTAYGGTAGAGVVYKLNAT